MDEELTYKTLVKAVENLKNARSPAIKEIKVPPCDYVMCKKCHHIYKWKYGWDFSVCCDKCGWPWREDTVLEKIEKAAQS